MATDGVKIIDGDLARDTYDEIMDLYDSNVEVDDIREQMPFVKTYYGSDTDFYHEIFVTAYALAFWEIGELTDEMLAEVKRVVALKAGVKGWTEECDEKEGRKRQKELDRFIKKISQPKQNVRKRKKYRLIRNLYFEPDDVLTFQLSDKNYYAVICAEVTQYRGQCTYDLVATTFKGNTKPTIEDLIPCYIAGRKIDSGYTPQITLLHQLNVDEIWRYTGDENSFLGVCYYLITHKDMKSLKEKFEVVGKLRIKESFKKHGSYRYESDFDRFESIFIDLDNHMKVFGEQKYPVTLLCEL